MKKLVIATLLAAATGLAVGQTNVTIYGIMDVGVVGSNHVGTANKSAVQVTSGGMHSSRLGFTATEDLGGGLKAGFKAESQLNMGDGSQGTSSSSGAANAVFSRAANVFVEDSKLGKVTLGRQDNAIYQAYNIGDIRGGQNFGSSVLFWNDGSTFGGTSTAKTGISSISGTSYVSNAVRYDTPEISGFKGSLQRTFGGVAGDVDASTRTTATVTYVQGPIKAAAGYSILRNSTGDKSGEVYTIGGQYVYQKFTAGLGFTNFNNPNGNGAANTDFDLYSVTGRYAVTPKFDVTLGRYELKDKVNAANGVKIVSLVGDYNISKRTTFYTGVAQADNQGSSGFAPYGAGGANLNSLAGSTMFPSSVQSAGLKQTAYIAGVTHRF